MTPSTPVKIIRFCAAVAVATLVLTPVGPDKIPALEARESFHFKNFSKLATGDHFQIIALTGYARGSKIGEGRVRQLSTDVLRFQFALQTVASGSVTGRIYLKYLGRAGKTKERFRLEYRGRTAAGPETRTEEVLADSFLIENGILALHFADRQRFFQLSIDSHGQNKFITNWGSSRLERTP